MTWTRLFRRLADKANDAAIVVKSPIGLQHAAVILHGGSCSGKSTIFQRLRRKFTGCAYMEADELQYWRLRGDPNILNLGFDLLKDAGVENDKAGALIRSIEQFGQHAEMAHSPYYVMVEFLKTCLANDAVIATCGNLPPPHGEFGYYRMLAECSGKSMVHVLIAPDKAELAKRIRSRGQVAQMERLFERNSWWFRHKASYDVVLTGNESTANIVESLRTSTKSPPLGRRH